MKHAPAATVDSGQKQRFRGGPVFPTFVVIGAMKSGTSSFHSFLGKHPQIFMSAHKGPALFLDPEEKISYPSNYRNIAEQRENRSDAELLLSLKAGYKGQPHFGESTTLYSRFPIVGANAPKKMLRCNPNIRLIYLLRNPIARIVSQFRYELGKPHNTPSGCFDEYLKISDAIATSKYVFQLCRYLNSGFVREQVHLMIFEELVACPAVALALVTSFLEIEDRGTWDLPHRNRSSWPDGRRELRLSHAQWRFLSRELLPQVAALEGLLKRRIPTWDLSEKAWTK